MSETRKLVAILCSDVVGYSRLAGVDEDRILARLRALRSDLIDPTIAVHNGRVVKRTGDGSIVEFRSVVDAVRCAIEVQSAMVERNAGVSEDRRIMFRIGIHLGDVVEEADGDLMGDGVNIAARLEGVASAGAICLSEDAYRQVRGRLDLKVTDLGPTQLKNIAEPIRAYSLQVGMPAQAKPAEPVKPVVPAPQTRRYRLAPIAAGIAALLIVIAGSGWWVLNANRPEGVAAKVPAVAARLSIVVLPFANLSNDPSQDYFADAITENLTTDLSRIRDSFVIARNTAFTYKGKAVDAKEIGKELGVRYVLEGSVQRAENRVRVNAQLIDAESGAHLWADRFEEDVADLFKLQDEVVARLGNALDYELIFAEARVRARIENLDAFDLAMRGRAATYRFQQDSTKENNLAARALYEQALALDPNEASALSGNAVTYVYDFAYGWGAADADYNAKILAQCDRALVLDRGDPRCYAAKATYLVTLHRSDEALRIVDEGLSLNPNSAILHGARGLDLIYVGKFEAAVAEVRQAMLLSPRDPAGGSWHNYLAVARLGLGDPEAAIDEATRAIDNGYRPYLVYTNLAVGYALKGDKEKASNALAEARRLNPKLNLKAIAQRYSAVPAYAEGLRKAGLPEE